MICIPGATLPELFVFRCHNMSFLGARICQPLPRLQSWREGRRGTICLQQTISSDVLNFIVIKHKISTKSCRYLLRNVIVFCTLPVIFIYVDTRFQGLQSIIFSFSLKKGFELSERLCDVRLSMPQLQEGAGSVIMFLTIMIMIFYLK